ncbi:probable blue pigment (indigoidine) exporter [Collimonas sp. OK242]|jgi:probable blue pigment (indigoidine) exporter|uniref:EamA family transporter n=1 Tax=Collimonas sp. OK242 TaxID=1798195 RepID=UPI00089BCB91|nr:EamA family transporter [Collimonas sp. OK242]SDY11546.1 probable blue pigment (indigoidine) exporter [Collimonas sp. OK242]
MKKINSTLNDTLLTAIAPAIWGSTYLVTTQLLPAGHPLMLAMLRALPVGLLLLLWLRKLPSGIWWLRVFVLGALNFTVFWSLLFVSAYRLPGGVAATVGAIQPLMVLMFSWLLFSQAPRRLALIAGAAGIAGVALLVLTPSAELDAIGIGAGLLGAVSMAIGTALSKRWAAPVAPLTFTAWQLTAGGLLLLALALWLEPPLPALSTQNIVGFVYLGLIGAGLTYWLWFRGLQKLQPAAAASLGLLSPVTATLLGWLILDQQLSPLQIFGAAIILVSVWLGQWSARPAAEKKQPAVQTVGCRNPGQAGC